jgi:hypothetical protein
VGVYGNKYAYFIIKILFSPWTIDDNAQFKFGVFFQTPFPPYFNESKLTHVLKYTIFFGTKPFPFNF